MSIQPPKQFTPTCFGDNFIQRQTSIIDLCSHCHPFYLFIIFDSLFSYYHFSLFSLFFDAKRPQQKCHGLLIATLHIFIICRFFFYCQTIFLDSLKAKRKCLWCIGTNLILRMYFCSPAVVTADSHLCRADSDISIMNFRKFIGMPCLF